MKRRTRRSATPSTQRKNLSAISKETGFVKRPAALVITLDAVKKDAALKPDGRGARKLLVTELYSGTEREATEVLWSPPAVAARCPVQVTADTELAVFTELASQDRHYHREATEIYMVVEG